MLSLKRVDRVDLTPSERILSEETNLESGELPCEDLFNDTEDWGPKVDEGVAKRVNSACTKRSAKEQFSSIQEKYLRLSSSESWVMGRFARQDKTKSREYSFQSFQKNLIKGIKPVVQLAIFKSCWRQ